MKPYAIELFPTHNEIRVNGAIELGLVRAIMEDLSRTPDFPRRQAIWIISDDVTPPPFHDFTLIIDMVREMLLPGDIGKRVAMVVAGGLNRALVEMFRREAVSLPLQLRVFLNRDEALAWITEAREANGSSS